MSRIHKVREMMKIICWCTAEFLVLLILIFLPKLAWGQAITFSKSVYPTNPVNYYAALADFNGDGILDLGSAGGTTVIINLGTASGSFDYGTVIKAIPDNSPNSVNAFVTGDFNGDGKMDFAI